jgi:hypothetical protein
MSLLVSDHNVSPAWISSAGICFLWNDLYFLKVTVAIWTSKELRWHTDGSSVHTDHVQVLRMVYVLLYCDYFLVIPAWENVYEVQSLKK